MRYYGLLMEKYHYRSSGLDNVWLCNGFNTRTLNGQDCVSISDIQGLHRALGQLLVEKTANLTGKEFRFLRKELDLSQKAIGHLFDVTDQTIANWEKNDNVLRSADVLIRNLYAESIGENPLVNNMLNALATIDRNYHEELLLGRAGDDLWVLIESCLG